MVRREQLQQKPVPPLLFELDVVPHPAGNEARRSVEPVVAPRGSGAAEGEQRASQAPLAVRRDEVEALAATPRYHVVAAHGGLAADAAPLLRALVVPRSLAGVSRAHVGLSVKLGPLQGVALKLSHRDHRSLLSGPVTSMRSQAPPSLEAMRAPGMPPQSSRSCPRL